MDIFLVLNGLGVVFLLYALVNFWKDGHRQKHEDQKFAGEPTEVQFVCVTGMGYLGLGEKQANRVLRFPIRNNEPEIDSNCPAPSPETDLAPVRRLSVR